MLGWIECQDEETAKTVAFALRHYGVPAAVHGDEHMSTVFPADIRKPAYDEIVTLWFVETKG